MTNILYILYSKYMDLSVPLNEPENNILIDIHTTDEANKYIPFFKLPENIILVSFTNIHCNFSGSGSEKMVLSKILSEPNWPERNQIPFGSLYFPGDEVYNPVMEWDSDIPYLTINKLNDENDEIIVGDKKSIYRSDLFEYLSENFNCGHLIIVYMTTCDPYFSPSTTTIKDWNIFYRLTMDKKIKINEIAQGHYDKFFPLVSQTRSKLFNLFKPLGSIGKIKDVKKKEINLRDQTIFMETSEPHRVCISPCRRLTCHGDCIKDETLDEEFNEYFQMPIYKGRCDAMTIDSKNPNDFLSDDDKLLKNINCEGMGFAGWSEDDYCIIEDEDELVRCIPANEQAYIDNEGYYFDGKNKSNLEYWKFFLESMPLPKFMIE
jgi:hypothetical protein